MTNKYSSKLLKQDKLAKPRKNGLPAFLSKPAGSPVYYGFPLIEDTRTNGWCFGAITEFEDPDGCDYGDGFVESPNGERAGLVWNVGRGEIKEIMPSSKGRWGVYQIWFPRLVKTTDDLVFNFRYVLPELKAVCTMAQKKKGFRNLFGFLGKKIKYK